MKFQRHLFLNEITLPPSAEWMDSSPGWRFLRVSQGAAYWLAHGAARELAPGDLVVVAPAGEGSLRASQLGEVKLHFFHFCPEQLSGFLTLSERHYLETSATQGKSAIRFLPATGTTAQEFAALIALEPSPNTLAQRCRLLHLVATAFADEMVRHQVPPARSSVALHRFKSLIQEMPDHELISRTPEQLAQLCGCSLRHFSRLFRKHFGTPIRAKQTELRLLKARQLLSDTDAKIIHVALESGYRHLGLFNAMFKKYLGMTPSQWRQKNLKKPRPQKIIRAAGILLLAAWSLMPAGAAEYPKGAPPATADPPPPAAPATNKAPAAAQATATNVPTFEVNGYEIRGNTLFSYDDLEPIFKKYVGAVVTFETIRKALAEFQLAYRDRGFVTVSVGLPQQQLTNGIVKVQVTEGRLTEINVVGNRHFSSNNVMRALPTLRANILLNSLVFQQDLDRANSSRDRQIYPVIGPGPDPGTTALTLKVKDRLPFHVRSELNNYSTPGTPEMRQNTSAQYNNLWQLEHQVGLQYSFTPEAMKMENQLPAFYDQPLVASYSAYYRAPLFVANDHRPRRDLKITDFGYDEVTHRFRPPPAGDTAEMVLYAARADSDTGSQLQSETLNPPVLPPGGGLQVSTRTLNQTLTKTENLGWRFNEPLPSFWGIRSSLSVGLDYKSYRSFSVQDRIFQGTYFVPIGTIGPPFMPNPGSLTASSTNLPPSLVEYVPFAVNFDLSRPDKWGSTSLSLYNSFQFTGLRNDSADFRKVAGSPRASGNYYIAILGLTREQKLIGDWGLRLRADGQWANQPLITNEQFALGGNAGVRGYQDGQEYGDTGWRALAEAHTPLFTVPLGEKKTMPMYVRFSLFTDYGQRYLLDPAAAGRPPSVSMWGAGFGFSGNIGEHFDFRLAFGMPLLDIPNVKAGSSRITFAIGAQF